MGRGGSIFFSNEGQSKVRVLVKTCEYGLSAFSWRVIPRVHHQNQIQTLAPPYRRFWGTLKHIRVYICYWFIYSIIVIGIFKYLPSPFHYGVLWTINSTLCPSISVLRPRIYSQSFFLRRAFRYVRKEIQTCFVEKEVCLKRGMKLWGCGVVGGWTLRPLARALV